jgi:hypothetical protein
MNSGRSRSRGRTKSKQLATALTSLQYPRKIQDSLLEGLFALPSKTLQRALEDTLGVLEGARTIEHALTKDERRVLESSSSDEAAVLDVKQERQGSVEEKALLEHDINRQRRICLAKSSRRDFLLRHLSQLQAGRPNAEADAAIQKLQTVRDDLEHFNDKSNSLLGELKTVLLAVTGKTRSSQPDLEPYVRADAKYVKKIMRWIATFNNPTDKDDPNMTTDVNNLEGSDIGTLQRELDRLEDATQKGENDLFSAELRLAQARAMQDYLSQVPHHTQQIRMCEASALRDNVSALDLESSELRSELDINRKAIAKLNSEAAQLRSVVILLRDHSAKRDRQQAQMRKQDELIEMLLDQQARHCVMLVAMRNDAEKSLQTNQAVKEIQDTALNTRESLMRRQAAYESVSACAHRQSVCVRDGDEYIHWLHEATTRSSQSTGSMLTTLSLLKCAQECMGRIAEVQQKADKLKATQQQQVQRLEHATAQLAGIVSATFLQPPELQQALGEAHDLKEKAVQILSPIFVDIKQRREHLQSNPKAAAARDLFVDFYMNEADVVSRLHAANAAPCGA